VLVSTHYMDEAARCHRLAYIAYGTLLAQGTPDELVARFEREPGFEAHGGVSRLEDIFIHLMKRAQAAEA
jgi:ABC-type multidrug transport system ATPase subunit